MQDESQLRIPSLSFASVIMIDDEEVPCSVKCSFIWSWDMEKIVPILGKITARGVTYYDDEISQADRERLEEEAYELRA